MEAHASELCYPLEREVNCVMNLNLNEENMKAQKGRKKLLIGSPKKNLFAVLLIAFIIFHFSLVISPQTGLFT